MSHQAEKTKELLYKKIHIKNISDINEKTIREADVLFLSFPTTNTTNANHRRFSNFLNYITKFIKNNCKLVIFADNNTSSILTFDLENEKKLHYKIWISIRQEPISNFNTLLNETKGAVIFSKSKDSLKICKVRIPYTYCPACQRTTKDYGGKKHLFHYYGTLMSDVWKDIKINPNDSLPQKVLNRIRDMFSIEPNNLMVAISLWDFDWANYPEKNRKLPLTVPEDNKIEPKYIISDSTLILGDAIEELKHIESNSIDYIFADPPYNLKKKYKGYHDNLEIREYLSWCDNWLNECYRILKPGKFISILNLPLWCSRHHAFLIEKMNFSSWITWEALSRPVRNIMPSHYAIITFQKPYYEENYHKINIDLAEELLPQADYLCVRPSCVKKREKKYKPLTDLWTDIFRLTHNSKRYNHPCQLPPKLMKRLISIYTNPGDIVLDCFNGVGTTTLTAQLLNRKYVGIDLVKKYHEIAEERHKDFSLGLDPFRKNKTSSDNKVKNNEEKRIKNSIPKTNGFTKKKVQLLIKELSEELNRIPTLDDALKHLNVPKEFYTDYFKNWSEVIAATKTTGMTDQRKPVKPLSFK